MRVLDLSHMLTPGMPVYPGDPQTDIRQAAFVETDHFAAAWLGMPSHAGTHVDVPAHMLSNGTDLDALPAETFIGTGAVVSVPRAAIAHTDVILPDTADFILFMSGWAQHWNTDQYYREHPYLLPETARMLAARGLKGIGMDFPSPDPVGVTAAHLHLFKAGMIVVENLCNLEKLPSDGFTFSCLPLPVAGGGGAPCRAVGMLP